jgi:hypothetical protein
MRLWGYFAPVQGAVLHIDTKTVKWLKIHSLLITAILAFGIMIWVHHLWFIFTALLIGAISYFFGLSVALTASLIFAAINLAYSFQPSYILTMEPAKLACYVCVAWLGFHHRQQKRIQNGQFKTTTHPVQVVPWSVANEIRTSLASVRYLLFPIQENHKLNEVNILTEELSRLEKIFEQIEKDSIEQETKSIHSEISFLKKK